MSGITARDKFSMKKESRTNPGKWRFGIFNKTYFSFTLIQYTFLQLKATIDPILKSYRSGFDHGNKYYAAGNARVRRTKTAVFGLHSDILIRICFA